VVEVKPTKVKDANLDNEINNVVGQLATGRADPSVLSLKQESIDESRELLGLGGVPSQARQAHQETLQQAKDEGFVTEAENNVQRAINGGEQLNSLEAAGALVRLAQLNLIANKKHELLSKATEPAAIAGLQTEVNRLLNSIDVMTTAIHNSGSEAGRRLNIQKLAVRLNEKMDYVSVVTRAKGQRGKELTKKQKEQFDEQTKELEQQRLEIERLQKEVADLMAMDFTNKGTTARYRNMNRSQIEAERNTLTSQIQQLLDEGC
jgi:hypothetical protein